MMVWLIVFAIPNQIEIYSSRKRAVQYVTDYFSAMHMKVEVVWKNKYNADVYCVKDNGDLEYNVASISAKTIK